MHRATKRDWRDVRAFHYELAELSDPNIADLIGPVPGLRLVNHWQLYF